MLNVLSSFIPNDERIVTIEDAAELQLRQEHVVTLESRPANIEGKGAIPIRELVRNALRMRPDRIIVGECRGGEALDMLQAMNTGHDGSMSTGHANTPRDMLARLETMVLMAGVELPLRAIREQIASAVDLIVHQDRLKDGTRKITNITEVQGMEGDVIVLQDVFIFEQTGIVEGKIQGHLKPTGVRPKFTEKFEVHGHPPAARPLRVHRTEADGSDDHRSSPLLAAVGVLLVFVSSSAAGARRRTSASSATPPRQPTKAKATKAERQDLRRAHRRRPRAFANFNRVVERRDWGANLARELARADLALKPSRVPGHPRRRDRRRARGRASCSARRSCPRWPTRSPGRRRRRRLLAAAVLARPAQGQAPQGVQQRPGRHDHAARQLAARRLVVPAGRRDGRARDAAADLDRVRARHPRGQPGPAVRQALANLVRRVQSDDLELMTTAIAIQHQVGGNLAEILDSIAFTIRERVRIKGEIKTLTAQQRMSGYVVGFLPVALVGILHRSSRPKFMDADAPEAARAARACRSACSSSASAA